LKTTVTSTSASITGLTSNTTYSFYVKAKDAAGNSSANSTTINVTTLPLIDTTPPTSPNGITNTAVSGTTLTIKWSNSYDLNGVISYDVYVNGIFSTTVPSTTATISGLSVSTIYSFYVIAKDVAGNISSASSSASFKTCDCF
jgi:chitodextrinase